MKIRKLYYMFVLLAGMYCLTGCLERVGGNNRFKETDKISIVTTIYPVYDFACNIAGDKAEIINLVPAGMEPHDFELSTGDMQLLEQADLFIYNGAGMEHFVDKTLNAVSNEELVVVECAKELELLVSAHNHEHGDSDGVHADGDENAEMTVQAHTDAGEEQGHDKEANMDPHTWLSVKNAILEAQAIKEALVSIDSQNAEYYEANYEAYCAELEALQDLYETELEGLSKNTIVVAHEAFEYLCEEYGLVQEAIEGLTADSEPDSARMKEIIDFCKEEEIKVIFFEELVSPKVAEVIASEIGAETMVLNPIEGLTAEQEEEGLDYIGLMKENLKALKKALQ